MGVAATDPPACSMQHSPSEETPASLPKKTPSTASGALETPTSMSIQSPAVAPPAKLGGTGKTVKKADWDAAQASVRLYYRSLCVYHKPYLNDKALRMLRITIVPLDLGSGEVLDGGPRFIEPASSVDMASFVARNKPWEEASLEPIPEDHHDHPKNLKGKPYAACTNFYMGEFMLASLQAFAQTPYDNGDEFFYFNKDWDSDLNDWSQMQRVDSQDYHLWSLHSINGSMVPRRPHAHAFLNHGIPLVENKLTTGEMAVATGIISNPRCFQGFNNHRYIHATIFSASFRDIRIIQVWHDREEPTVLHVRRSPIMNFMEGEKANREDWITLLCWMMGDQLDPMSNQDREMGKSQEKQPASSQPAVNQLGSNHSDSSHSDDSHSDSNHSDSIESDGSFCDHAEEIPRASQDKTPGETPSPPSTT